MSKTVGSEVKVIARHSSIYGLANVLDRIVTFVMLPVYTRFLTPADYGILELVYMTTSIISLVVGLGIESAVSRFYFDFEEQEKRNRVVSTAFLGYGGMALVVTLLLLPFSGIMARNILGSAEMKSYFVVALITLGLGMIGPIAYAYFRATQRSFTLMVFQVSKTTVSLGLNIYYVVFAGMGVYGILLASLISTGAFTVVTTFFVLRRTGIRTEFKLLWQMVKFGLPLIPSSLSGYLVHASDRFFIKEYATLTLTGLYSLGYKFGALVNQFVTSPFIQIWMPRRFEYFDRDDSERIYARIFTYFVTFSLFVGLQLSVLSREIIQIATAEPYWSSYRVVPIIVLSYIIFSFHYHFNIGILMKKQTKYIAYINIVNGILNLALNFILIKKYDIWGAAYATLICFVFKAGLTYYYSNRFYKIQMEWRRLIMLFLVAFATYFLVMRIETGSVWINLPVKAVAACGFAMALYAVRFFTAEEIKRFKRIVKTRKLDFD
jgi:O-antigen/teichoic acid export membrane protein